MDHERPRPHPLSYILVVDDDTSLREVIVELLEDEGYRTRAAANGVEALQVLRQFEVLPCLILLDIMMPLMDGFSFRREQLQDPYLASIPVVVMGAGSHFQTQAQHLGMDFLAKPFTVNDLLTKVAQYCTPPP